jgi:hypothetical protein
MYAIVYAIVVIDIRQWALAVRISKWSMAQTRRSSRLYTRSPMTTQGREHTEQHQGTEKGQTVQSL